MTHALRWFATSCLAVSGRTNMLDGKKRGLGCEDWVNCSGLVLIVMSTLSPTILVQWKIPTLETKHIFQGPVFH